jgi:hypothetical protein
MPAITFFIDISRGGTLLLNSASEQVNHRAIECRDVVRLAGGNKIAVSNRFFIDPFSPGVAQVGHERQPRSDLSASSEMRREMLGALSAWFFAELTSES